MWPAGLLLGAAAIAVVAAWTDWRSRSVPNAVPVALLGIWLVAAASGGSVVVGAPLGDALLCGVAGLVVGVFGYLRGWFGAGDAKLLAALALWVGPADAAFALLGTGILLAVLLSALLTAHGAAQRRRGVPVACALAPPAAFVLAARGLAGAA